MRKCSSTVNCVELRILRLDGDRQTSLPSFTTTTNQPKQGGGWLHLWESSQADPPNSRGCGCQYVMPNFHNGTHLLERVSKLKFFFSFKRKILEKVLGITYARDSSYLQNFKKILLIGMKVLIITGKTCIRQPPKAPVKIGIIGQVACM